MKRIVIFVVVFLLLAALVGGFAYFQFVMKPQMIQQAILNQPKPLVTVSVEPAKAETWRPGLPAIGTLEAVQGIDLAAEVGGIVDAVEFESGEEVEQGALLVELDTAVEQAQLKAAEAQLKQSQLDQQRQRELAQRGNTPQSSLDAAIAERDSNAAEVERIRALIAQKMILAPFPGRLGIREVDLGQYISAGEPLVTLTQLDPLFLDFPMPEQHLGRLSVGQEVTAQVDAFPGETFTGRLASLDARVNQETRNILVRAELANPDRRLLPGMFVNVTVLDNDAKEVVTLPRTAISYSLYGDSVYVVKEPGEGAVPAGAEADAEDGSEADTGAEAEAEAEAEAGVEDDAEADAGAGGEGPAEAGAAEDTFELERRVVKVGETRDGRVEVLEGVEAGERVVTTGQNKLYPGQKVKISDEPGLQPLTERPRL